MNELASMEKETSFKDFLFKDRRNRTILWSSAIAMVIQFAFFKYIYPNASFIHGDSFSYLYAADQNLDINFYPIGYSKFLRLFSVFNRTDYVFTAFQYLILQLSSLYFLFTIYFFYKPGRIVQYILLGFMVLNPLFLHLGNLVSSDCLFAGLSLIWLALLLWIIQKPSPKILFWHAIVLFLAFIIRYNALIYPFISLVAFAVSRMPLRRKFIGLGAAAVLCGSFVGFTMWKYKQLTDYWQYSPFSGWQFANNAMYAYRYVDSVDRKPVPEKFKLLDNMVRQFYDSTRDLKKFPFEKAEASTFYMWSRKMPLMAYRDVVVKTKDNSEDSEFKKWATVAPLYKEYGLYIISQYPSYFIIHFAGPNIRKYFSPPVEFLESYNSGKNYVLPLAVKWFGYKDNILRIRSDSPMVWVLNFYTIFTGIINFIMLFGILYYCLLKGWKSDLVFKNMLLIAGILWFLNAGFTIFAASAALRFQSFPIFITTTFAFLLIDWMIQLMRKLKNDNNHLQKMEFKEPTEILA
jgi:hypothetical protein